MATTPSEVRDYAREFTIVDNENNLIFTDDLIQRVIDEVNDEEAPYIDLKLFKNRRYAELNAVCHVITCVWDMSSMEFSAKSMTVTDLSRTISQNITGWNTWERTKYGMLLMGDSIASGNIMGA